MAGKTREQSSSHTRLVAGGFVISLERLESFAGVCMMVRMALQLNRYHVG